jgi:hypothetical protein
MLRQGRAPVAAAGALVSLGSAAAPARKDLAELLFAADPTLRVQGAMALWHIDGNVGWLLDVTNAILDRPRGAAALALDHLAEVGPPAAPLLPKLVAQLGHSDAWHRVPAARAVWRITRDEGLVAPVLVAAAGPEPVGLQALETLAELSPAISVPLATKLLEWVEADRRPIALASVDDLVEEDERLVALCRALLERIEQS